MCKIILFPKYGERYKKNGSKVTRVAIERCQFYFAWTLWSVPMLVLSLNGSNGTCSQNFLRNKEHPVPRALPSLLRQSNTAALAQRHFHRHYHLCYRWMHLKLQLHYQCLQSLRNSYWFHVKVYLPRTASSIPTFMAKVFASYLSCFGEDMAAVRESHAVSSNSQFKWLKP